MNHRFIVFNTKTELLRLDVSKIVYFEGDGNYTQIVTVNKLKAVVCQNLTQMEKYLLEHLADSKSIFMRVGKRFIVNTSYIYQINTQKQQLILSDYERFAFALGISKEALRQALYYSSDVGVTRAVDRAFADKKQFFESVKKMSFGQPLEVEGLKMDACSQDSIEMPWYYYAMGFQEIAPIQMLTFYNAIADEGKMVMPLLFEPSPMSEDTLQVINPQIAKASCITEIRKMLEGVITEGLGKRAMSDKVKVAGMNGAIYNEDSTLTADFCGYFPADKPKYTVLVSVHRKERPAAGGRMAGAVFKEIAEYLFQEIV